MMELKDISTAPKDPRWILAYSEKMGFFEIVKRCFDRDDCWLISDDGEKRDISTGMGIGRTFSHWAELPKLLCDKEFSKDKQDNWRVKLAKSYFICANAIPYTTEYKGE